MRDLSGIMGGLHHIANWIMRLSLINITWFIINLPIVIIVISAMQHQEVSGKLLYLLPALPLIPFLLFPSTTAMFAISRDWLMKREQTALIKTYFSYFKNNYRQSLLSGMIWAVIWMIWLVDIFFFYQNSELFTILILIFGLLLFVMNINYFSVHVHYHMKIKEQFKQAFFVTVGSPLLFFIILIVNFLLVMTTMEIWFLFPFFSGSLSACLSFYAFYQFSLKIERKAVESRN